MSALYVAQIIAAHNLRVAAAAAAGLRGVPAPIALPRPTGECTECGGQCWGSLCDACAADLEPAAEDCLGCSVSTDVNDLDEDGHCGRCRREADDASLEALP